jgi:hypothetical protein
MGRGRAAHRGIGRLGRPGGMTINSVFEAASDAADAARSFMASDRGRRMRRQVATVLIVAAPVISELPVIRRHPVARILRTAGMAALVVKGAEWLRDWQPQVVPDLSS